ncbi:3-hydroxyisobutyrate dehydrogenase [Pokkaliibacter plantistimulans]|uniref:3-hydroxyisobutyrate dehydrogenase n=1 Tax=Pokkaliibacter plantistimulans TaxID=1635171 RepID=A0ABX5LUJ4_9GAMM|nr:3-hydroxyisobutyrate dehydrogenase [Pokkaliibacter plantistimulans]PXF29897.1 3-hydroxyisobutyrate dehydrogenase [Pokkaliibacter plantistimulans]
MATIGFIGLGNMGGPMAVNLVKAGHNVTVFDLFPDAMARVVDAGARAAASAKEAVTGAEIVISMLPAGKHVESLFVSGDGLFDVISKGALVIDSSTIDADTAKKVAAVAESKGLQFIDAPVSGGVAGAAAGTLTFIVGGSDEAFSHALPVLQAMGKNIFHAGSVGAGQVAKVCNNMMLGILMAGTAEALNLGIKNGLDPKVLSDIMVNSSGRNWALELYNPVPGVMENAPASREYQGGFMVDLMVKDLGLAQEVSLGSQSATPMGALARNLFNLHAKQGNGRLDFSSIYQFFKQ